MPRPGPRPYVCERRAWHSDRHQPIRGSLVQEIFRVVNEIHCSTTKKNKEWQEKLPVVVLKAEEIMYSKANSEAEYMDLKTLWDRTNDAINTIIRRDESTETGEFLPPCIEAALNLGCTARRTLRSQRNCNPRCYLNPGSQEAENIAQGNLKANSHCTASYSGIMRPTSMNVSLPSNNQCLPIEKYPPNLYSAFPLFYGNHLRFEELRRDLSTFPELNSKVVAPATMGYIHNLSLSNVDSRNQHELACDLSLRLGPFSTPCPSVRNSQSWAPPIDRNLYSFLRSKDDDPLNSSWNEQSVASEHKNVDATMRKRKTVHGPAADRQFCLPSKFPYSGLSGRMKSAGS